MPRFTLFQHVGGGGGGRCNLCIAGKFYILCKPECATLNGRSELVSGCRHREKFLLRNVK